MADKLRRFKTYKQEYFRDRRRGDKQHGQVEARLESDRQEVEQDTQISVSATARY